MTEKDFLSNFSVVIPAYNAENMLEKCLSSITRAPPLKKEIIVVDDGSSDHTQDIALKFPVNLIRLDKNYGSSTAKNIGLAQATGDIIAFIDSDCVVGEDYFLNLISVFNSVDSDVGGIEGVILPLENGIISDSFRVRFFGYSLAKGEKIVETDCAAGGASAFPKKRLVEIGGFDTSLQGEDLDLSIRLRKAGYKLLTVPSAKVYHPHPNTLRELVIKWFRYGEDLAEISLKNHIKKDIVLSCGWVLSCLLLSVLTFLNKLLIIWLPFLFVFCLPWIIFYSRQTVMFLIHTRKIRYFVLPFIHQIVILSRSIGVLVGTIRYLLKI